MSIPFYKISSNFKVSWDIDSIINKFIDVDIPSVRLPYSDPKGNPHWQYFPTQLSFARNFFKNFKNECIEIADQLITLQHTIKLKTYKNESLLIDIFLNHKINPAGVNIIRMLPGDNAKLHKDITRNLCINIGLRNSNICKTSIGEDNDIKKFWPGKKFDYIMEDGDVYIIKINNPHCVEPLVKSEQKLTRYVISYSM